MTEIFNITKEKLKRKILRNNMPQPEIILWSKLKNKGLLGLKFRRQYSVRNFVVDFYCPEFKLAIEIDGDSHFVEDADVYDKERQIIIESYGINFLRYTNDDINKNLDGVLNSIAEFVKRTSPDSSPL